MTSAYYVISMILLDLGGVLSVLLAVAVMMMLPIIIGTFIYRRAMLAFYYVRLKHKVQIDRNTYRCFHNALIGFNSFYSGLSQNAKAIFIKRIAMFLETKTFHGRDQVQLTEEIKVRIAGAYVLDSAWRRLNLYKLERAWNPLMYHVGFETKDFKPVDFAFLPEKGKIIYNYEAAWNKFNATLLDDKKENFWTHRNVLVASILINMLLTIMSPL